MSTEQAWGCMLGWAQQGVVHCRLQEHAVGELLWRATKPLPAVLRELKVDKLQLS